jgi:hypothetical protein
MTAREFFSFPDPVDDVAARTVATGVVAMAGAALALDQPLLLAPLTYGFAARVAAGPRLSPLGRFATKVVAPRVPGTHRRSPGAPKRLAQGMGFTLSATSALLWTTGRPRAAKVVLSALLGAAGLEAAFGYCVACRLFPVLVRAGIVPASACEDCADISRRWKR